MNAPHHQIQPHQIHRPIHPQYEYNHTPHTYINDEGGEQEYMPFGLVFFITSLVFGVVALIFNLFSIAIDTISIAAVRLNESGLVAVLLAISFLLFIGVVWLLILHSSKQRPALSPIYEKTPDQPQTSPRPAQTVAQSQTMTHSLPHSTAIYAQSVHSPDQPQTSPRLSQVRHSPSQSSLDQSQTVLSPTQSDQYSQTENRAIFCGQHEILTNVFGDRYTFKSTIEVDHIIRLIDTLGYNNKGVFFTYQNIIDIVKDHTGAGIGKSKIQKALYLSEYALHETANNRTRWRFKTLAEIGG